MQVILVHCVVPLKHTSDQGCAVALDCATVLISLPSLVRQAPAREYPAYCFVQCGRREPARLLGTLDSAISDPGRALTQARTQWLKQHFCCVNTFGWSRLSAPEPDKAANLSLSGVALKPDLLVSSYISIPVLLAKRFALQDPGYPIW